MRGMEPGATWADYEAAARQYVRKISGYREPSQANQAVFEQAVADIADVTERLMDSFAVGS